MSGRAVTIVVPTDASPDAVAGAIASVLEHVDLTVHSLVVVDDAGCPPPVEDRLRGLLRDRPNARYERSDRPLGILLAVNRAVVELDHSENDVLLLRGGAELTAGALDALLEVLHDGERHGIVVPRSNRGALTLPSARRAGAGELAPQDSFRIFESVREALPSSTVIPTGGDLCLLVRHDLIRTYGLFDTEFHSPRGASIDLTMRMARLGHSTVVAHRAFVLQPGPAASPSPSVAATELVAGDVDELDLDRLARSYPFLASVAEDFARFDIAAVDRFAEALHHEPGRRPSVLIDLYQLTLHYDGTARNAISFLDSLQKRAPGLDADFFVQVSESVAEFFRIERFGFPIVSVHDDPKIYDVALSLTPLTHSDAILTLNHKALRWVVLHLDIIALRSLELRSAAWARKRVVRDSLRYADHVVSISEASVADIRDFFPDLPLDAGRVTVVPQGVATARFAARPGDVTFRTLEPAVRRLVESKPYVLVMGNGFPHKQVDRALASLATQELPVISLGGHPEEASYPGVHFLPTGRLSDELLQRLIASAALLVYPSAYEGFGLPLAEAVAAGTRVLAFSSDAVDESVRALGIGGFVDFFSDFDELPALTTAAVARPRPAARDRERIRTSGEFDDRLIDLLLEQAASSVDLVQLAARWDHFVTLGEYRRDIGVAYEGLLRTHQESRTYIRLVQARRSYRLTERLISTVDPVWKLAQRMRARLRRTDEA